MPVFDLKIAKIVGADDDLHWSQNHIFLPENKEKKSLYGSLLVSFSFKAKKEEIDVTSFGKEIISRFHELYYSSSEEKVLTRLKLSLKSLLSEFNDQVDLEISSSVVIEKENQLIGYFALFGKGKVIIFRENQLVELLNRAEEEIKTSSGYLKNNDLIGLATTQFFKIVDSEVLKPALETKDPDQAAETLAPTIHAQEKNSQTAAIFFKTKIKTESDLVAKESASVVKTEEVVEAKEELQKEPEKETAVSEKKEETFTPQKKVPGKKFFSNLAVLAKNVPLVAKKTLKDLKKQPNIFIKDKQKKTRAKKTTLTVAFVLIALLSISLVLGSKKKSFLKESERVQQIIEEVEYKYDQANSLLELNPLRARSLLNEAKELIKEAEMEVEAEESKEKLAQLLSQIDSQLEGAAKEYKLETVDVFLDLSLVKEEFKGDDWDFDEGLLQIFDQEKSTVLEVEIEDKGAKVSAGGEKLNGGEKIGFSNDLIFVAKKDELVVVDSDKGEAIDTQEGDDWGKITDLVGFSGNAYLLDTNKGTIWKYVQTDKGLSSGGNYLKGEDLDLEDGVSLAIDGSVWLLFSDGTIVKFTRGVKDPFSVSGLDKNFQEPEKIYTDPELDNLYILDRQNTRVVLIDKETGEYKAQYVWSGIAGAVDLFASEEESKIFLLTGERIYEIELKE